MVMNSIQSIRERLGVTQSVFGDGIGCTQGNVGHLERGQTVMPPVAEKIIEFAKSKGLEIGFDHIYGNAPLPDLTEPAKVES
jgi:putative transcriptional regulator